VRDNRSDVVRLFVDKTGMINDWPPGFFDQSEKDLANLAGWV
jgi:predicted ATPase